MTKLRHCYPRGFRPAKVFERRRYYSALNYGLMEEWFNKRPEGLRKPIFYVDPGNETRYFLHEFRDSLGRLMYFEVDGISELRERMMQFLPEDLYYDRNVYRDREKCAACEKKGKGCPYCEDLLGQELMFDIDPENIDCPNCGTLEDRVNGRAMFKFCYICFNKAVDFTQGLHSMVESMGIGRPVTVYSGRGFHVYVEGKGALKMGFKERSSISKEIKAKGFPIDTWVSDGEARLARVPYSLNGMVSRICMPIEIAEIKKMDFWRSRQFVPEFVKITSS